MEDIQNYVNQFGFGISKNKLAEKAYWAMKAQDHDVCMVNDKYLEVDGTTYQFIKSRTQDRWIVKSF